MLWPKNSSMRMRQAMRCITYHVTFA